jgi:hypothetical protein
MIDKNCLLIDDQASVQKRVFEQLVSTPLRAQGINVNLLIVDPTDKDLYSDEKLDKDKLKQAIVSKIDGKKIDLVGCDYELSSDVINGVDVVQMIRSLRSKVKIFLYSGKFEKILGDILGDYKSEDAASKTKSIDRIKKIYGSRIEDFLERNDYPARFIGVLKKNEDSIDDVFLKKIREYENTEFKSCFPQFEGKSLSEVANEIENETHLGQKFIDELIEQTIAYLIKSNEDE